MLTKQNYKLLAEVEFLNKSEAGSMYYQVSFGKVNISVRVSDHYNNKWKGDMHIVVNFPKNISIQDLKGRAFETMDNKYKKLIGIKKQKNDKTRRTS